AEKMHTSSFVARSLHTEQDVYRYSRRAPAIGGELLIGLRRTPFVSILISQPRAACGSRALRRKRGGRRAALAPFRTARAPLRTRLSVSLAPARAGSVSRPARANVRTRVRRARRTGCRRADGARHRAAC